MTNIPEREQAQAAITQLTAYITREGDSLRIPSVPAGQYDPNVAQLQIIANYLNGDNEIRVDGIYGNNTKDALRSVVGLPVGFNPDDGLSRHELGHIVNIASVRAAAGEAGAAVTGKLGDIADGAQDLVAGARQRLGRAILGG